MFDEKLRIAQLHECDLLRKFKEICEIEGLTYFLLGGTAIGAVRHGGFIPWDDDIDVGLLRKDYEKFLKVAKKYLDKNMSLLHYSCDKEYRDYTMKLVNSNIKFITQRSSKTVEQNIWIDIFPIDEIPGNLIKKNLHFLINKYYRMLLGFSNIEEERVIDNRTCGKKVIYALAKIMHLSRFVDGYKVKVKLDKQLKRYEGKGEPLLGNLMGAYHEREVFGKEIFVGEEKQKREIEFEGEVYSVPYKLEQYLEQQYGDYMKLPPIDYQVPKHKIIDIKLED